MYKYKRSKNRRNTKPSNSSHTKNSSNRGYGKSAYNSSNSRGRWKRKNRRQMRETIAHTRYISKAVDVKASSIYIPEKNFYDFDLHDVLARNIVNRSYLNPTKIQDQTIPETLKGKDILGIGRTGTGKTGAFLIPMIDKVLKNPEQRVLIITPTRELANQISSEFRKFATNTKLRTVLVIGGANIRDQIRLLSEKGRGASYRTKPQFVVATPGRLIDLEKRHCIDLSNFNNVILDEVDQMLAMGFVDDVKLIVSKLASNRQSLFFAATMSHKEEVIANTLLNTPVKVESDKQAPLKSIHQDIVKVRSGEHKMQVLHELLKKKEFNKVLVFSGTRIGADSISYELRKKGIMVDSLHGDKPQHKRSKILAKFRNDKIDVLIATDVAARGIDIPDISHVINYDEPANYNDYIHRIGRTGRIGKKGTALTFVLSKRY